MVKPSKILFWLVLGILPVGTALPQDTAGNLTLQAAEQEAVEHSPQYQRALSEEREAGWGQMEAVSDGFLPHLAVKGQYFPEVQYSALNVQFGNFPPSQFPGIFPKTSLALDASFDLFDGFRNLHKLDAANHQHEAAKIMAGRSLLDLGGRVELSFYRALAAQMLSDMADQNVKTLEDHYRIAEDVLKSGQATRYDLLRVDVQLSESKSDQLTAHDNVLLARETLAQVMGLKNDNRPLKGELPVLDPDALLKSLTDDDLKQSPDLRAGELKALAADDQSAASENFWFPKVSVVGEYEWYNSPDYLGGSVVDSSVYRNSYFLGASASWDILDGGLSLAKANEAGEKAKQAKEEYEAVKLSTPYDFNLWKRRLISSTALYQAKLTDVEKAKESARLATAGFKAGTRTTTDVLDAELEQYRAAAGMVEAQINALEAMFNLELVLGRKVRHE